MHLTHASWFLPSPYKTFCFFYSIHIWRFSFYHDMFSAWHSLLMSCFSSLSTWMRKIKLLLMNFWFIWMELKTKVWCFFFSNSFSLYFILLQELVCYYKNWFVIKSQINLDPVEIHSYNQKHLCRNHIIWHLRIVWTCGKKWHVINIKLFNV